MNRVLIAMNVQQPVGYWIEYRPGDPCIYGLADFARETYRSGGEIRGLYTTPQPGCSATPAAYRGRYFHQAKHCLHNGGMDPDAVPLYFGQVLHEPAHDAAAWGVTLAAQKGEKL